MSLPRVTKQVISGTLDTWTNRHNPTCCSLGWNWTVPVSRPPVAKLCIVCHRHSPYSVYMTCTVIVVGKHDGVLNGKRYFNCPQNHGTFVPLQEIICKVGKKVILVQWTENTLKYKSINFIQFSKPISTRHHMIDSFRVQRKPQVETNH